MNGDDDTRTVRDGVNERRRGREEIAKASNERSLSAVTRAILSGPFYSL